jgi:hypothetical protein
MLWMQKASPDKDANSNYPLVLWVGGSIPSRCKPVAQSVEQKFGKVHPDKAIHSNKKILMLSPRAVTEWV